MQKTISIIGCGWLGLPLGAFLVKKGYQVKGSTTRKEKFPLLAEEGISPFHIKAGLQLKGENLDAFFQSEILIINVSPGRKRPNVAIIHPIEIKNVIEKAKEGKVRKIIFVSSTSVYTNTNSIVTEKDLTDPSTSSGKALIEIETYLQSMTSSKSTILRMAGLVGGDRKTGRFLAGKKNVPNADAPVNLVHREDCIRVIYEIIRQEIWGQVFNVCSDGHPARKEFYTLQAEKQGLEAPVFITGGVVSYKIISNEKLKRILNYTFSYPDPKEF